MLILSILTGLFALFLLADALFLGGALYRALPEFAAPLSAFVGFLLALLYHGDLKDRGKTKHQKGRRAAMAFMGIDLFICVAAASYQLYLILS